MRDYTRSNSRFSKNWLEQVYIRAAENQTNNFLPYDCPFNQDWLYCLPGLSREWSTSQLDSLLMRDKKTNVPKLYDPSCHCFCGRATKLSKLRSKSITSTYLQASFSLFKKDNHIRYWVREWSYRLPVERDIWRAENNEICREELCQQHKRWWDNYRILFLFW